MVLAVRDTPEFRRVRDLPRRTVSIDNEIVESLTRELSINDRCPGTITAAGLCSVCDAPMRLRPKQALALLELMDGGAFLPLGVGEGKTLVTLLAPYVLDSQTPLLLLPANLIGKTRLERDRDSRHWRIPTHLRLMSYEMLAIKEHATDLEAYKPDLLICDEAHNLKNPKAARTRRVKRWMEEHPETRFVPASGTMMSKSVMEFGHLATWALKSGAPVPLKRYELEEWARALDEPANDWTEPFDPGPLIELCSEEDANEDFLTTVRRGFRRRLLETPGVIATTGDGERVICSLQIRALPYRLPRELDPLFKKLREQWLAPADDYELMSGAEVWAHAKALALGLTYVWDPRPPKEWLQPRKAWGAFVRETISRSRTWDSEAHVAEAIDLRRVDDSGVLAAWRAVRPSFEPNSVAVWHDDTALRLCGKWAERPGIVWTDHAAFGVRLAELYGLEYYGSEGLNACGELVDHGDASRAIVVSTQANKEGRNLQTKWSRNLVTCPWERSGRWEQAIGRTHRPGQKADVVIVDVLRGCQEHENAWRKALASARAVRDTTGAEQKILIADVDWPD